MLAYHGYITDPDTELWDNPRENNLTSIYYLAGDLLVHVATLLFLILGNEVLNNADGWIFSNACVWHLLKEGQKKNATKI